MYDFIAGLMLMGAVGGSQGLPFWATANQYGLMPQYSGLLVTAGAGCAYDPSKTFQWRWGVEGAFNTSDKIFVPAQAYASAKWKFLSVDLGIKHREMTFLAGDDPFLGSLSSTSGHLIESGNARSYPGYNLILHPVGFHFKKGGSLTIRGSWGDYWTTDNRYVQGTLLHRIQGYLQYTSPGDVFHAEVGLDHYTLWAGTSPEYGVLPHSFKDYLRVVTGRNASSDGPDIDKNNALGDHGGAEHLLLKYNHNDWDLTFQLERPYSDKSGMKFYNFPDGLYTFGFSFKDKDKWVSDVVFEYMYTMWQSGTMHENSEGVIVGGNDNYFNNEEYRSGWTSYARPICSPFFFPYGTHGGTWKQGELIGGPMAADNVEFSLENNRMRLFHVGIGGKFFKKAPYKLMLSYSMNYGIYKHPYIAPGSGGSDWKWYQKNTLDKPLRQFSLGLTGRVPINKLLSATYGLYWDQGEVLSNNFGATAGIAFVFRK